MLSGVSVALGISVFSGSGVASMPGSGVASTPGFGVGVGFEIGASERGGTITIPFSSVSSVRNPLPSLL